MSCFSVAYIPIARHRGFSGTMAPREKIPEIRGTEAGSVTKSMHAK